MTQTLVDAWIFGATPNAGFFEPPSAFSTTDGRGASMDRAPPQISKHTQLNSRLSSTSTKLPSLQTRLLERAPDSVRDAELLQMVLSLVVSQQRAERLSVSLIRRFGSFDATIDASKVELKKIHGISEATAEVLRVVQLASQRLIRSKVIDRPVIANWAALLDYLYSVLSHERIEQCRVLFLDARNHLVADEVLGRGTVNHVSVYPREVIKRALELNATALILVHNHPSGDPTPSNEDIELTCQVSDAAKVMDIILHDHIIIGQGSAVSFRMKGLIPSLRFTDVSMAGDCHRDSKSQFVKGFRR